MRIWYPIINKNERVDQPSESVNAKKQCSIRTYCTVKVSATTKTETDEELLCYKAGISQWRRSQVRQLESR